ncbi:MAG: hypothetical protein JF615_00730 [Asticcacaulis sp.]|nr:hypothetical protein [Asticcacaulis sp.]
MKFPQVTRAPEGLTSYAKVKRARPVQTLITILEAVLSLVGVVVIILAVRFGSFAKAGTAVDQAFGCAIRCVHQLISHVHK